MDITGHGDNGFTRTIPYDWADDGSYTSGFCRFYPSYVWVCLTLNYLFVECLPLKEVV